MSLETDGDFEWCAPTERRFECARCGACPSDQALTYDALGYVVCPSCGHTAGP